MAVWLAAGLDDRVHNYFEFFSSMTSRVQHCTSQHNTTPSAQTQTKSCQDKTEHGWREGKQLLRRATHSTPCQKGVGPTRTAGLRPVVKIFEWSGCCCCCVCSEEERTIKVYKERTISWHRSTLPSISHAIVALV